MPGPEQVQVKAEFVNVDGVLTEDLNMLMPEMVGFGGGCSRT